MEAINNSSQCPSIVATLCHYRVGNQARLDDLFQKRLELICYQQFQLSFSPDQRPRRQIIADKYA